jgi:predicted DNA-binding transcriptional regulator AlpA
MSTCKQIGEYMKQAHEKHETILRIDQVCDRLGVSDTTLWRWRRAKTFPEPKSVRGSSMKGWTASTINSWIAEHFGDERGVEK